MREKILAILFIFGVIFCKFSNVFAAVNEKYGTEAIQSTYEYSNGSIVLNWVADIGYNFANAVERLGARIVKIFTGQRNFPWADKVIFNTIPILDINFINPASGSLFEDVDGNQTFLGKVVKNIYFTILSVSIGFLSIIIGVIAIRLAISSIASEKAKCKEAIINFFICIVMIFMMHYLLSFIFYLNETLVSLASYVLTEQLGETTTELINSIQEDGDKENKQLLENFFTANNDQCFVSSIPVVGKIWDGIRSVLQGIANALGKFFAWLTNNQSDEDECDIETLKKIYPKREDYVNALKENDQRINVAAYLLKDKFYRNTYFKWTSGTDVNSFANGGVGGVLRNIAVTANDIFGVVDTGYKSIRSLYTSTMFITFVPDGSSKAYQTTSTETYEKLDDKQKEKYAESNDENTRKKYDIDNSSYLANIIKSNKDYLDYMEQADKELQQAQSENNKEKVLTYTLSMLYAEAYYKYVYNGDDKIKPSANAFISELGEYFKSTAYYVDLDNGDWAPDTINVISAMIYAIFVIQSLLFFISYLKRFFYVMILSMFGPIVIVFDYIIKSI